MEPLDALVELCAQRLLEERQELGGVFTAGLLREIALEGVGPLQAAQRQPLPALLRDAAVSRA